MNSIRGGTRGACSFGRPWTTFSAMLLWSVGYLNTPSWARTACSVTQTKPIRVGSTSGVDALRAAVNCTDGGAVAADWVGAVTLDAPIAIADGTFLSVTGEDHLAEVLGGGGSGSFGTRLFELSPGGGLALSHLKLSGGTAAEGGAIYSSYGTLSLESCIVEGNVATDGDGGAVWANGGSVTIVGGEFLNNSAIRYGGAVHATDARLDVLEGCRFEANEASAGGGLFCGSTTLEMASTLCSLTDTAFWSNRADFANPDDDIDEDASSPLEGGGAAAFRFADATVTDSVFRGNYARVAGGALFGGYFTNISVDGCTLKNNTSGYNGGAVSASSMTLRGSTQLEDNSAGHSGGAVIGWDPSGTIVFNDVLCTNNYARENGGCFHDNGKAIVNEGTAMLLNSGEHGGCIYVNAGRSIIVNGGVFTSRPSVRGGAMFASENTTVLITGGLFADNQCTKNGGALYLDGDGASTISIEGGTFRNNTALQVGGAITVWGAEVVLTITGGTFEDNAASFFGGFLYMEISASIHCSGATIRRNFAGEQGGGIYARDTTVINSSCNLIANESPQGAAIYLVNVPIATFENHNVTDNLASSGSPVHLASSSVVAKGVTFKSELGFLAYSSNLAIQLDERATLDADQCVFDGWLGETVVYNLNPANGSLVLDSCDFRQSSANKAVVSLNSDAEIRNAAVSSFTFKNVVAEDTLNSSLTLVDRALECSDSNACGDGECVDSLLGVLCECLEGGECLNDGGELSISVKTRAKNETFSPDPVSYELLVSSAASGTTSAIWYLLFEGGGLVLDVVPSSGVLSPGGSATVQVTGTPSKQNMGGDLISSFTLMSVGSDSSGSSAGGRGVKLEVVSTFYLCQAYEYAMPVDGDYYDIDGGILCEQCATIVGGDGVECTSPGATLASLPIREGYWRSSNESLVVQECLHYDACAGATKTASPDDYCANGYTGPYCAVCSDDYGSGVGNDCHRCDDTKAQLLIAMGVAFSVVLVLLLLLAVVFLIGGLDAIEIVRQSVGQAFSVGSKSFSTRLSATARPSAGRKRSAGSKVSSTGHSDIVRPYLARKFSAGSRASCTGPSLSPSRSQKKYTSLEDEVAPSYAFATGATCAGDGGGDRGGGGSVAPSYSFASAATCLDDSGYDHGVGVGGGGGDGDGGGGGGDRGGGAVAPSCTLAPAARCPDDGDRDGGCGGGGVGPHTLGRSRVFPSATSDFDATEWISTPTVGLDFGVWTGVELSTETGKRPSSNVGGVFSGRRARRGEVAGVDGVQASTKVTKATVKEEEAETGEKPRGLGLGATVKRCVSRLPLDKIKILVVVWQILAVFSSITGVEFPASYSVFLSWISVVNLDIGSIFSASCVLPSVNFYTRLLLMTLAPLGFAAGLVLTYKTARRRASIGSAGVIARRAAWSRHVAAGLLLTFLVFTSASTVAFKTFACDADVVEGQSYLRDDYSISCDTTLHMYFQVYAGLMILVYPIGIPVLYATILWKNRELLNPRIHTEPDEEATRADPARKEDTPSAAPLTALKGQTKNIYSPEELNQLQEVVKARKVHPDLAPSMFLWKDFDPELYYYEVVECGRRILLTGLLIFIKPHTATQTAMSCLFAFASLLGFELMRPHMDPADMWLYRLGCVIIFLTNFLALLIKVDAGEDSDRAAFGVLMVAVNVLLVVAVIVTSWFAVQQSVNDSREDENSFTIAQAMLTAEQSAAESARHTRADQKLRERVIPR